MIEEYSNAVISEACPFHSGIMLVTQTSCHEGGDRNDIGDVIGLHLNVRASHTSCSCWVCKRLSAKGISTLAFMFQCKCIRESVSKGVLGVHLGVNCVSSTSTLAWESNFLVTTYLSVHCNSVFLTVSNTSVDVAKWMCYREGSSHQCHKEQHPTPQRRLKRQQLFKRLKGTNEEDGDKALEQGDKTTKPRVRDLLSREQGRAAFGESRRLFKKKHLVLGWDGVLCCGSPRNFRLHRPRFGMTGTGRWAATWWRGRYLWSRPLWRAP